MDMTIFEPSDADQAQAFLNARRNGGRATAAEFDPLPAHERVNVIRMADVRAETVRWLWRGYMPLGKLTVLEGDPGLGKSTLSLAIAAAVSRGSELPGCPASEPADVVLLSYEDGLSDTLRPRLDAAGADLTRIHAVRGVTPLGHKEERLASFPTDAVEVFNVVKRLGARLVIIDPLSASLTAETDSYKDADIRRALAPIAAAAEMSGAAVLVIRHLTKAAGRAITAGGGSIGIAAAARAVLAVYEDPDRPEDKGARLLAVVKSNLSARAASLAFRLESADGESPRIVWQGESPRNADALSALRGSSESPAEDHELGDWLRSQLADSPQNRKDIFKQGRSAGFPPRSIDRAAQRIGVRRVQSGFGKEKRSDWSLPSIAPNRAHLRLLHGDGENGGNGAIEDHPLPPPDLFDELPQ